jgi:hypothetical protein
MPTEHIPKNVFIKPPPLLVGSRQRNAASDEKAKETTRNAPLTVASFQELEIRGRSANTTVPAMTNSLDFNRSVMDISLPE